MHKTAKTKLIWLGLAALGVVLAALALTRDDLEIYLEVSEFEHTLGQPEDSVPKDQFQKTMRSLASSISEFSLRESTVFDALTSMSQLSGLNFLANTSISGEAPCVSLDANDRTIFDILREIALDYEKSQSQAIAITMLERGVLGLDLKDPNDTWAFELIPVDTIRDQVWLARYFFLEARLELSPSTLKAVIANQSGGDWSGLESLEIEGTRLIVYAERERRERVRAAIERLRTLAGRR